MKSAKYLASLAAASRQCISLQTPTWYLHPYITTQGAAGNSRTAEHTSQCSEACFWQPNTPDSGSTPRLANTWRPPNATAAPRSIGGSHSSSWCRCHFTKHGPGLGQVRHVSCAASSGGDATDAGAGTTQERCRSESSDVQARVQQQWNVALVHAVGAEAVAGGDAALRELLQAAARVRSGAPHSVLPTQLAAGLMAFYQRQLLPEGRRHFFQLLTSAFGVQAQEIEEAIAGWQAPTSGAAASGAQLAAARRLCSASQPLYRHLFVPLSQQQGGIKFLVDLRAHVRQLLQERPSGAEPLRALDNALRGVLQEWFSVGLLQLRLITWQGSSGALLQKVMQYEAVEPMLGWADLEQRLYPNRRVHAFFHPALPAEPLIILHAALRQSVASTVAEVLDENREGTASSADSSALSATAAVFYSVSSTQKGLAGVDLGHSLIAQVAHKLLRELPNLRHLATLSPVPGFRAWLEMRLEQEVQAGTGWSTVPILQASEAEDVLGALGTAGCRSAAFALQAHLQESDMSAEQPEVAGIMEPLLLRLAAQYLLVERRRGKALDQVANFHLRNGASVWRLNWMADPSARGMAESFGIRVNYRYEVQHLLANNRQYVVDGRIAAAPSVLCMLGAEPGAESEQWVVQLSD